MNDQTPLKSGGSLLERASRVFEFSRAILRPDVPPAPPVTPFVPAAPAPVIQTAAPADQADAPRKKRRAPVRLSPVGGRRGTLDKAGLLDAGYFLPGTPAGVLGEELRIAKRALLVGFDAPEAAEDEADRTLIMVTSAHANEGKTFCAINLATSIAAERDVEVLLVDGDFAKPSIVSTLGLTNGPGLMDVLIDPAIDVESCIIHTDIPGFAVLPAGQRTHNDTEALASARARSSFAALSRGGSRIVILDSPPTLAASPASVMALHVGQVVLIVKADETGESALREAVSLLGGCDMIRLLLNGVTYATGDQQFGTYYGYGD